MFLHISLVNSAATNPFSPGLWGSERDEYAHLDRSRFLLPLNPLLAGIFAAGITLMSSRLVSPRTTVSSAQTSVGTKGR